MSFPIANFPDAHFPEAHFPHDAPEGGGDVIILYFNDFVIEAYQEEDEMLRIYPPVSVTKSDSEFDNARLADGSNPELIWIGTAGDVTVFMPDQTEFVYPAMVAGGWLLVAPFTGVKSTGTTATAIAVSRRF